LLLAEIVPTALIEKVQY